MITVVLNNVNCRLVGIDQQLNEQLYDYWSFDVPGAHFARRKYRQWDGKKHFYKPGWKTSPSGLLPYILQFFAERGIPVTIQDERNKFPLHWREIDLASVADLRPHQKEAIEYLRQSSCAGLEWPRGILHHTTAAGKTELAAGVIQSLQERALFLVDRRSLLRQTKRRFEEALQQTVGWIGDNEFQLEEVTVATFQTLLARLDSKKSSRAMQKLVRDYLATVRLLFIDECHRSRSKLFGKVLSKVDAYVRVGLSATILEEEIDDIYDWTLIGHTGGKLHAVSSKRGWEEEWLARPLVHPVLIQEPQLPSKMKADEVYELGIVTNSLRNEWFVQKALECEAKKELALILVHQITPISHGELFQDMLEFEGLPQVPFIYGQTPLVKREKLVEQFLKRQFHVMIASSVFNEGIDIPELQHILNATGTGSWKTAKQQAGRGMRKKYESENRLDLWDCLDTGHKKLRDASIARFTTYQRENFPFAATIIPEGRILCAS